MTIVITPLTAFTKNDDGTRYERDGWVISAVFVDEIPYWKITSPTGFVIKKLHSSAMSAAKHIENMANFKN